MASSRKVTSILNVKADTVVAVGRDEPQVAEPPPVAPLENARALPGAPPDVDSATPVPPEVQQIIVRHGSGWQSTALVVVSMLLSIIAVAFYAFHRVGVLNTQMTDTMVRVERKIQNLDAGIAFDSKRQQLHLGIRDEIMRANPQVSLNEAYEYSTLIMQASDKYPSVDPLVILAIGMVESGYDRLATSNANAKGLYQIWPSTGRLLARSLDWEYTEDMLYDPVTNTEMAALYLDILYATYNDQRMVLAEYNGGPLNAGYLRAGSSRAAVETREYVKKVDTVYQRLKNKFELGVEVRLEPMHKDQNRDGKLLGRTSRYSRTASAPTTNAPAAVGAQ